LSNYLQFGHLVKRELTKEVVEGMTFRFSSEKGGNPVLDRAEILWNEIGQSERIPRFVA